MNNINKQAESSLINECYESIQTNIINGTFAPGKKLKVRELAELLNTGHSPIREALSRLIHSGLVQAIDNKGFRVSQLSEADMRDVYHTYLQIELLALKQAIDNGDDAWKTSIVAALYNLSLIETSNTVPHVDEWLKRNYEFHLALIAGCNSPTLLELRSFVYRKFDRYCRISFNVASHTLSFNYAEHQQLADAVLHKNYAEAINIMTHHILGSFNDVLLTLKKNDLLR